MAERGIEADFGVVAHDAEAVGTDQAHAVGAREVEHGALQVGALRAHLLEAGRNHDCGCDPRIGGVAQGVGGALYERMAYDESGQLLNASFMDFLMPYVTEVPDVIDIDHLETPSPLNPLGIKGAGEAGVIPSAAVFAAAIEDAERLSPSGLAITAMPISPSDLFELRLSHEVVSRLAPLAPQPPEA